MDGGRLVAVGDARSVTEKYRTFVRGAGSPSVGQSLVEGDVEEGSYPDDTTWREEAILRVLSGDSVVEVAGELGVPPGRLRRWRDSFLQGGRDALADLISQARPESGGAVSDDD